MLAIEYLAAHLAYLGAAEPYAYNRAPLRPDRCVTLTEVPGAIGELEDGLDNPYIQVRTRSEKNNPKTARDVAQKIDEIMMDHTSWPAFIDAHWVVGAGRVGGPPAFMSIDDENRCTYVCNYYLTIARISSAATT